MVLAPGRTSSRWSSRTRRRLGAAGVLTAGAVLPLGLVTDGGLLWLVLIGGGIALLVTELRRAGRRR
ncbi:hypothetical protein [Geodermatophilus sp. DF01-2]|uniref:hypothetical protein n=1 Tax=Geodermatophilus sp. DF01-2 TaxID=2559610 RepID=UPI001ADD726C|nr:hypothetical protein [Geodermatophilus sp. DF01_2]